MTDDVRSGGMHARPVVGGFFIKMLTDRAIWHKWASGDKTKPRTWAPLPKPPKITVVVPAADKQPAHVELYDQTAGRWTGLDPDFDDSAWKQGESGFGTAGTPGAIIGTIWQTDDIWLRREMDLPVGKLR